MHAVILAAGKSTRTYPLTLTRPKPLLPVANKPILAHQLDALRGIVDRVVLVVGYRGDMIHRHFGDSYGKMKLDYVTQTNQLGTGHALLQCRGNVDGPMLVMNGDDLFAAEDLHKLSRETQGVLSKHIDDPRLFAVFETDDQSDLVRIVEKPETIISNQANIGAYKFTEEVFAVLEQTRPSKRNEIEITSAIQSIAETSPFKVVPAAGHWLPIGYPWDLLTATTYLLDQFPPEGIDGDVHDATDISGPVSIGSGTRIRPGVVIEGPVCIGENCQIGPNCWIRPHSAIGNGCKVGHAVEIKASILMEGARVPHLSYVGDSVIGAEANLGCGTITANFRHDGLTHRSMVKGELIDTGLRKLGAIIGDHVHTGINTSIYPGRKLWPGSSTLPGEVVSRDRESGTP